MGNGNGGWVFKHMCIARPKLAGRAEEIKLLKEEGKKHAE